MNGMSGKNFSMLHAMMNSSSKNRKSRFTVMPRTNSPTYIWPSPGQSIVRVLATEGFLGPRLSLIFGIGLGHVLLGQVISFGRARVQWPCTRAPLVIL